MPRRERLSLSCELCSADIVEPIYREGYMVCAGCAVERLGELIRMRAGVRWEDEKSIVRRRR